MKSAISNSFSTKPKGLPNYEDVSKALIVTTNVRTVRAPVLSKV